LCVLGRYQEALASFDKSLALQTDPITLNSKGSVLHRIGRLDEALECYEQAIARSPRYAEATCNRANTLLDLERYLDAIAAYDKALLLEPGNARAWSSRANALQQLEQYTQAVQSYDQALKISADDAHTLSNRSISLWSGGNFAAALKSADLALAINPLLAPTWSHRGNVLRAWPPARCARQQRSGHFAGWRQCGSSSEQELLPAPGREMARRLALVRMAQAP
jgi:tetratricopeptide (TPR) repeat protein